ncbi:hypothetical protein [Fulvivirga ligni]|uniref:hypothetical protein n=1 Tax=Fulvivirga ligni TaxID=2904246 RepID=UPI001F2C80DC|nr:hypothetical protein [Fulvivirga ligni]UII22326.1 hypothetical protein LVD16_03665 [Fulvivirga ligni]
MIVWSGRGFLSVLILFLSFALCVSILPKDLSNYAFVVACLAAGAFSWFMGKKWNEQEGQIVIDKATGQEINLKPNHSLFWIKLQYWGIIFGVLALVFLVQIFV